MNEEHEKDLGIEDPSSLLDNDWVEINKARAAYKTGGLAALSQTLDDLRDRNFVCYARIIGAMFPGEMREAIKDEMAELGMDEDDLRELIRKLESPAGKQ